MSAYTDGDSKWYFNDVPVVENENYVYDVQYKSDAPSKLTVRYTTSSGTYIYSEIANLDPAASWTHVEKQITVPATVTSLTVFHILSQVGNLSIDEAFLSNPGAILGTPFANGMLTFSFDDGWLSQKDNAIPVLNARNIKGTFGIITDEMAYADTQAPWDQVYMNTAETLAVQTAGHEIASHTRTHANLPTLDVT